MRPKIFKPGTFLRIPLKDGSFGYGRVLSRVDIAFYNYRTTEPPTEATVELDAIEASPVLFTVGARVFSDSGWDKLGVRPLYGEVARPVVNRASPAACLSSVA